MVNGYSAAEQQTRDAAAAAVGAAREMAAPTADVVTLSNGVTLKLKPVSGLLIRRAVTKLDPPKVPLWHNPDRGRDEPNPNDPDYQIALERYNENTSNAALNAMFLLGTQLISVPDDVAAVEDKSWSDTLAYLDIEAAPDGPARYLDWLKYVACAATEDLLTMTTECARMSGLSEEDVMNAIGTFRSGTVGGADSAPAPEVSGDGDRIPAHSAGAGGGDRTA